MLRQRSRLEDVMVIVAILGGLVLGGTVFAFLRQSGQSSQSREKGLHIV